MSILTPAEIRALRFAAGTLSCVLAGAVTAQVQSGQSGQALDASPQVGSGGDNGPVNNAIDYTARNNLITGNVGGGFDFRDDVGYGAPGAFQGQLGSDDLFRFRADSIASAPVVARANRGYINPGNISVYNSYTNPAAGTYAPGARSYVGDGAVFQVNPNSTGNPYELSVTQPVVSGDIGSPINRGSVQNRLSYDQTTLGVIATPEGGPMAVTADPLTGLRQQRVGRATLSPETTVPEGMGRLPGATPGFSGVPGAGDLIPGLDNVPELRPGPSTNYVDPNTPASSQALRQGSVESLRAAAAQGQTLPSLSGQVKPTLLLGTLTAGRAGTSPQTLEQQVNALQASIFGPTSAPGTPGGPGSTGSNSGTATPGAEGDAATQPGDAYTRLIDEIRQQAAARAERTEGARGEETDSPDQRPAWMRALDEPSNEQLQTAESDLQATMARIRDNADRRRVNMEAARAARDGEDPATTNSPAINDPGTTGEADPARRTEAQNALSNLLEDLSYDIRLETLVSEREGRVDSLFQEAETALASGKFLDAERTYRQVRLESPDNPLGQVGLIHAQLGAGMVRSAAFNLRSLFEEHPELIATRYGQKLLPPPERLEWLRGELQRAIDRGNADFDPGLMLAYLGHQVESRQLVRYGLAIALDASPLDPLLPVLRRIWLGEDDKPAPQSK